MTTTAKSKNKSKSSNNGSTKPKKKKDRNKSKTDDEENYSIAKLLEKKQQTTSDFEYDDDSDDSNENSNNDAVNALIEQTEMIRQSTIATVMEYQELQNSPIRNPLKLATLDSIDNADEKKAMRKLMQQSKKKKKAIREIDPPSEESALIPIDALTVNNPMDVTSDTAPMTDLDMSTSFLVPENSDDDNNNNNNSAATSISTTKKLKKIRKKKKGEIVEAVENTLETIDVPVEIMDREQRTSKGKKKKDKRKLTTADTTEEMVNIVEREDGLNHKISDIDKDGTNKDEKYNAIKLDNQSTSTDSNLLQHHDDDNIESDVLPQSIDNVEQYASSDNNSQTNDDRIDPGQKQAEDSTLNETKDENYINEAHTDTNNKETDKTQKKRWRLNTMWSKKKQSDATAPEERRNSKRDKKKQHISSAHALPYHDTEVDKQYHGRDKNIKSENDQSLSNFDSSDMSQATEDCHQNNPTVAKFAGNILSNDAGDILSNCANTNGEDTDGNIDGYDIGSKGNNHDDTVQDDDGYDTGNDLDIADIINDTRDENAEENYVDGKAVPSPYYDEDDDIYDDDDYYSYNMSHYGPNRMINDQQQDASASPEWILDDNTGEYYYIDEYGQYQYYDEDDYDDDGNYLYKNDRECYNHNTGVPEDEELTNHDTDYNNIYMQYQHIDADISARMQKSLQDHQRKKRIRRQRYMYLLMGLIGCCIIIGSIVLLVLLLLPSKNDNEAQPQEDIHALCIPYTNDETMLTVCSNYTNAILPVHPNSTLHKLYSTINDVSASCQSQSFNWLISRTDSNSKTIYNTEQMIQRYAMTVLHCELYSSKWLQLDLHLSGINHACTWSKSDLFDPITGASVSNCNANNEVTVIRIIGNNEKNVDDKNREKHDLPFRGTLPPEVSMIKTLQEFTIQDQFSNLYGTIPIEYASTLSVLNKLVLSSNGLNGSVPSVNDFIYQIAYVDLSNNALTGTIPERANKVPQPTSGSASLSSSQLRTSSSSATSKLGHKSFHGSHYDDSYYYYTRHGTRHRNIQQKSESNSTHQVTPTFLFLNDNQLSGIVSLPDILHPYMEELTLHNNKFVGRLITPSSPDQARKLKLFTIYNNNITGNLNSLCSLSDTGDSNDETKFVVDTDKIVCTCCTNISSIEGNIVGGAPPTIAVPKIPPPSNVPTKVPTTTIPMLSNTTSSYPTLLSENSTLTIAPSSAPTGIHSNASLAPTRNNGSFNVTTFVPSGMPSITLEVIDTTVPTVTGNSTMETLAPVPVSNNIINSNNTDNTTIFTPYKPYANMTTTRMGPYYIGVCRNESEIQPNILNQCECQNSIQVLANDIATLYSQVREKINTELYSGSFNHSISSCAAQNQALIWLSSGNVRDSGDLYQRYILALVYIQMKGMLWYDNLNWFTHFTECDWAGVVCNNNTKQIESIVLNNNNLTNAIPSEIRYLSALQILSFGSNRITGTIPMSILTVPRLEQIILSNNSLSGTIPSSPMPLSKSLIKIRFDTNKISGTIPDWIGNITTLSTISLHTNSLSGTIPPSLGTNLKALQYLALHKNRLSGTIPTVLGLLSNLQFFTIDQNAIVGTIPNEICQLRSSQSLQFSTLIADVCPTNSSSVSTSTTAVSLCPSSTTTTTVVPCCSSCRTVV